MREGQRQTSNQIKAAAASLIDQNSQDWPAAIIAAATI
jgi:hypothetical protein